MKRERILEFVSKMKALSAAVAVSATLGTGMVESASANPLKDLNEAMKGVRDVLSQVRNTASAGINTMISVESTKNTLNNLLNRIAGDQTLKKELETYSGILQRFVSGTEELGNKTANLREMYKGLESKNAAPILIYKDAAHSISVGYNEKLSTTGYLIEDTKTKAKAFHPFGTNLMLTEKGSTIQNVADPVVAKNLNEMVKKLDMVASKDLEYLQAQKQKKEKEKETTKEIAKEQSFSLEETQEVYRSFGF
ncbi:MAG: hypothetical protein ABDI07_10525 [Candidatus Kryptonium sp.]